jgi:hypothetical protein
VVVAAAEGAGAGAEAVLVPAARLQDVLVPLVRLREEVAAAVVAEAVVDAAGEEAVPPRAQPLTVALRAQRVLPLLRERFWPRSRQLLRVPHQWHQERRCRLLTFRCHPTTATCSRFTQRPVWATDRALPVTLTDTRRMDGCRR